MNGRFVLAGNRLATHLLRPAVCSVAALCSVPVWAQSPIPNPALGPGNLPGNRMTPGPFTGPGPLTLPDSTSALPGLLPPPDAAAVPGAPAAEVPPLPTKNNAATMAWEQAQAAERDRPGSFTPLQLAVLRRQALAQTLRWAVAERDQRVGMARFSELDAALAEFDEAVAQATAASASAAPEDQAAWRDVIVGLQSDRLLALLERGRSADAIALYENLRDSGAQLQPYVLIAAADALTQQRRSAEAVPIYEAALFRADGSSSLPVDTQFGLIYAYLDVGRFEDADRLLTKIEADTPALMRLTPVPGQPNNEYSSVAGMRGFFLLYTERLQEAEEHFNALVAEAPFNAGYAEGAAETQRLRGHPNAALAQFEALSANHPYDRNIRAGHAQTLLDLHEYAAARRIGRTLADDYPDSTFLRKFERQERAATGAFLEVDANAGKGSGNVLADHSWNIDGRISSGLMGDEWRVFFDQTLSSGDTANGRTQWARAGLGGSWTRGGWLAEARLQQANRAPYRTSVGGRVSYRLDDHWEFAASADGNSKEVPWRARDVDIGAREVSANAAYIVNESRRFDASLQQIRYSDDNRRDGAALSWRERWISGPRFQMETLLGADASRSRDQTVPYFSPAHDASVQLGVRGQWLTWKNDDRQFFQIAEVSAGGYRQSDFSTKSLWSLRYEHQWILGPKLQLRYGLSISSHPYDGVNERQKNIFINFLVPLS